MNQSLRMLVRDWRAGELRVLAMALVVAVASITSVAFFADRVSRALVRDAHQLLGADLVLVSDRPWKNGVGEEIARRGLQRAQATTFISMVISGESSQLSGVKAVSENYPLRGRLRIAPAVNAPDARHHRARAWHGLGRGAPHHRACGAGGLDPEARQRDAAGRCDPDARTRARRQLLQHCAAPVHERRRRAFDRTGADRQPRLVLPLRGRPARGHDALESWARGALERGQRVDNLESGRPEVRGAIERAQRFLGLTALLAAILAGVAIALGTRRFVERHLDSCAVMRCLGVTQRRLLALFGLEFLLLGLLSCALGVVIGFAAQTLIAEILGGLLRPTCPRPRRCPRCRASSSGWCCCWVFRCRRSFS